MTGEERENALHCLKVMIDEEVCEECKLYGTTGTDHCEADCVRVAIKALEQEPKTDKYEYHTDHTDCIWYGNDSGCPTTCSQYRDGWNDAMEYIFKDGKGYQPYRRGEE